MNISRLLKQTIVYWAPGATDVHGDTAWSTGEELTGRWEDINEVVTNKEGKDELASSVVYLNGDETVVMDGRMYLGELADLSSSQDDDPRIVATAQRIISIKKSPGVRNRDTLLKIWLK